MNHKKLMTSFVAMAIIALMTSLSFADTAGVTRVKNDTEYRPGPANPALNGGSKDYQGFLRVMMVEPDSRWDNYDNETYYNGFLDFVMEVPFMLADGDTLVEIAGWRGSDHGYGDVDEHNLKAIAVVFNMSQSYPASSDTIGGSAAPFDAYYVDAAAAATTSEQWNNTVNDSFTHSVFIDQGTGTYCPSCPPVTTNLYQVEQLYDYPFFYAAMVIDEEPDASAWLNNHYNLYWVPTCYYDGGDEVVVGSHGTATMVSKIKAVGSRPVTTYGLSVDLRLISGSQYEVTVTMSRNEPPAMPDTPTGITIGATGIEYEFTTDCSDPDGDDFYYRFVWAEGDTSLWIGPYGPGSKHTIPHTWTTTGTHDVKVKSRDGWGFESGYTSPLTVTIYAYLAGDADANKILNILDITYLINFLYKGGPTPDPYEAGDANGSGVVNILDVTHLINFLYKGGPPPVYPD